MFRSQLQERDDALAIQPAISLLDVPAKKLDDRFHVFITYSKLASFDCWIKNGLIVNRHLVSIGITSGQELLASSQNP